MLLLLLYAVGPFLIVSVAVVVLAFPFRSLSHTPLDPRRNNGSSESLRNLRQNIGHVARFRTGLLMNYLSHSCIVLSLVENIRYPEMLNVLKKNKTFLHRSEMTTSNIFLSLFCAELRDETRDRESSRFEKHYDHYFKHITGKFH